MPTVSHPARRVAAKKVSWLDISSSLCLHPEHGSDSVGMLCWPEQPPAGPCGSCLGAGQGSGLAPTAGLLPQAGQSCHFHITRAFAALYPCVSSILFLTFYQFQFVFVSYFLPGSQLFKNNIMNVFYMSYVCVISQLLRLIYHRLSILHLLL